VDGGAALVIRHEQKDQPLIEEGYIEENPEPVFVNVLRSTIQPAAGRYDK
jgi:hypothetical protein